MPYHTATRPYVPEQSFLAAETGQLWVGHEL